MQSRVLLLAFTAAMAGLRVLPTSAGEAESEDIETTVMQAQDFYGPLRIRDMGPVGFTRLHVVPDHAVQPYAGAFALELHLAHSNTFATGGEVLNFLEERGGRAPLSSQDVADIFARPGNAYLFDAALSVYQLTAHYGLGDRWSVFGSLPVYRYGRGRFDNVIENFHDTFGFSDFGRSHVPQDQFLALLELDGQQVVLTEPPKDSGVGDPVIGARYYWPLREREAVTVQVAHKFATQNPRSFTSTGSSDTAIQFSWQKRLVDNAWYVNVAGVRVGNAAPFPDKTREIIPSLNVAWEYRAFEHTNLVVQLNGQRSLFRDGGETELAENLYQASIGLRHRVGEFVWSYALTENLVNFNNTADLGFHIGFVWIPR